MSFERHVYSVQRYVRFTQPRYVPLFRSGVVVHPICCFGNPANARVITVGVNPSVGEFEGARWPAEPIPHKELAERCKSYFTEDGNPPEHLFFAPWNAALACLDVSYADGTAVHIDLSPRASRYVREFRDAFEQELFLEMVSRDLWSFFGMLELCSSARLLLIAGSVTGKFYINEFLQRIAPDFGWALGGAFDRRQQPGPGKTCWHELADANRRLRVFFCSCGPAADTPDLLGQRICENAPALLGGLQE